MTTPSPLNRNNPGNLRYDKDVVWQGQSLAYSDSFVVFYDPIMGLRAMLFVLWRYIVREGCKDITDVVTKYAPPSENDTAAYIANVSASMRITADTPLTYPQDLAGLCYAMIHQEQGKDIYPIAAITGLVTYLYATNTLPKENPYP